VTLWTWWPPCAWRVGDGDIRADVCREVTFGDPFYFLDGPIAFGLLRACCWRWSGRGCLRTLWEKHSRRALLCSASPSLLVLIPGLGAKINGARRWIRIGR